MVRSRREPNLEKLVDRRKRAREESGRLGRNVLQDFLFLDLMPLFFGPVGC